MELGYVKPDHRCNEIEIEDQICDYWFIFKIFRKLKCGLYQICVSIGNRCKFDDSVKILPSTMPIPAKIKGSNISQKI